VKVTTGFQSSEGGRFYEVELSEDTAIAVVGAEKWGSLNPFTQALALGLLGDMMSVSYAKAAHILKVDYDARMGDLKAQLRELMK